MATMKDWADQVSSTILLKRPSVGSFWDIEYPPSRVNRNGVTVSPLLLQFPDTVWPFSGFFDWFDNRTLGSGYLPSFMTHNAVRVSTNFGISTNEYRVNEQWIFVGLNPNFKLSKKATPANNWNFMGFNMDPGDPQNGYINGPCGTLCDLWKIMDLFCRIPDLKRVYECFKAAYITDIAVLLNGSNSSWANTQINTNPLHYQLFKEELIVYKQVLYPGTQNEDFRHIKFLAFGGKAFDSLQNFSISQKTLFPGATIYKLDHYSGYAMKTAQQLVALAQSHCPTCKQNVPLFYPSTLEDPIVWGAE